MVDFDLDRVRQAWLDASDVAIARALEHPEDYEPGAFVIVEAEAARRNLDAEALHPGQLEESTPLPAVALWARRGSAKTFRLLGRVIRARPIELAALGSVVIATAGLLLPFPRTPVLGVCRALAAPIVFWCFLACVFWPYGEYRKAARVVLAGGLGYAAVLVVVIVHTLWSVPSFPNRAVIGWFTVTAVTSWLIPLGLVGGIIYVRNRYWPVYPAGHCANCGYNLRGLPKPRCPECGTPFDVGGQGTSG